MIVVYTTIVEARIQSVKKKMEISRNQEMADKAAKMWYDDVGSKDALRIVPYFVLPQSCPIFAYREADAPLLCSYRAGH